MATKSVLVVDDEADLREAIADALHERGWTVMEASDGARALDLLHEPGHTPDVILLDIMMPVMDGWQFRSAQLHDAALHDIPVVVFSAHELVRAAAIGMGITAFVRKPVRVDELSATLDRARATAH